MPSATLVESKVEDWEVPRTKRLKTHHHFEELGHEDPQILSESEIESYDESAFVASHPRGIKPLGNAYESKINLKSSCGHFSLLPDELLTQVLEYLPASSLVRLGSTCKALYAFSRSEELWKTLFIESHPLDFTWQGSWRSTLLSIPSTHESQVSCVGLFSDVLYRPYQCANLSLKAYAENIPKRNLILRTHDLTYEEYAEEWMDKPFILTCPVKKWPIYKAWTLQHLLDKYREVAFRAEAVDWPLHTYVDYMQNNTDESPLYLFDRSFAEKMDLTVPPPSSHPPKDSKAAAYWPPTTFGPDLFVHLDVQRPDNKWLIIGPARSGSTFHKDPNGTSAWNAVITGRKYWLMFPPHISSTPTGLPPGIFLSEDKSEITSPLSIAEYLLTFHAEARRTVGCIEGICEAGEVLHVPSGWFHLVVNLEESIAVTQNFVPRKKLPDVLQFLRDTPDQASGFRVSVQDPYGLFVDKLRDKDGEALDEAMAVLERRDKARGKGRWEELTKGPVKGDVAEEDEEDRGGFSFGFA